MLIRSSFRLGVFAAALLCVSLSAIAQEPTPGWNTPLRNADGSVKIAVELGGGYNTTAGAARNYQDSGWNTRIGGGYRFNRRFAALIEYNYDRFTLPQSIMASDPVASNQFFAANTGSVHIWSFTLEPTFQYFSTERLGGYLIGGGGFYRKVIQVRYECPSGQSCNNKPGNNKNVASNNSGGANLGAGFAWRTWDHSNTKLFLEGRYVWVDSQPQTHYSAYPSVYKRTGYFPVTAGLRW